MHSDLFLQMRQEDLQREPETLSGRPCRDEYQAARRAFHEVSHGVGDAKWIVARGRKRLIGRRYGDVEMVRLADIDVRQRAWTIATEQILDRIDGPGCRGEPNALQWRAG